MKEDWNSMDLEELFKMSELDFFSIVAARPAAPVPAPELEPIAAGLRPFVGRVFGWANGHEFEPTPVFLAESRWFRHEMNRYGLIGGANAEIGGWFESYPMRPETGRIVMKSPWEGSTFQKSVLLHESVHAMQKAMNRLWPLTKHQNEFEAYRVQMAYLATQGFDVRNEGKFFSERNLFGQTMSSDLFADNYNWLEPWEKEYKL